MKFRKWILGSSFLLAIAMVAPSAVAEEEFFFRMLTDDETVDVFPVHTVVVTNGTLTDQGSGIVALDTGGGGGSDTNANWTKTLMLASGLPVEASDAVPPLSKDAGTNIDMLPTPYDADTDECRTAYFDMDSDASATGNIDFSLWWYSLTATTGNVEWYIASHGGTAEGADPDASLTNRESGADAVQGTVGQLTKTTWSVAQSTLGWGAGEFIPVVICRDANDGTTDTMLGDAQALLLHIEGERA